MLGYDFVCGHFRVCRIVMQSLHLPAIRAVTFVNQLYDECECLTNTNYNRENEMYNFSKRNVQFLPFFRGLSAEYSNGI